MPLPGNQNTERETELEQQKFDLVLLFQIIQVRLHLLRPASQMPRAQENRNRMGRRW